ncbi:MAG: rRNA pseudouridine synthase [Oscillospiraceae bacterium]|nr:rRNA pseudouridine synthase [Oscillospiraceae bacterium]
MQERLQKIISAYGRASRREAEKLINDGRVSVNGIVAYVGQSADISCDEIIVDGVSLLQKDAPVYIMLNKPRGYITSVRDDRGRKTVMDLTSDVGTRIYPVGRLDLDSEGLLLLTNDGQFANDVAHPSKGKIKTYLVRVSGDIKEGLDILSKPMQIDEHVVSAHGVKLLKQTESGGILSISIHEGRNRQIRKMCAHAKLRVLSLKRVSVGAVTLGNLGVGKWRHLTEAERNLLWKKTF